MRETKSQTKKGNTIGSEQLHEGHSVSVCENQRRERERESSQDGYGTVLFNLKHAHQHLC